MCYVTENTARKFHTHAFQRADFGPQSLLEVLVLLLVDTVAAGHVVPGGPFTFTPNDKQKPQRRATCWYNLLAYGVTRFAGSVTLATGG